MKIIDILENSKETVFSFELLPPLKGQNADKLYRMIEALMDYDPKYINITTHRDEVEYVDLDNGLSQKHYLRKRPGTVAIAASIQHRYNVPVVPHLVCGGFTKEENENMLLDLNFLGIENILALRGDGVKGDSVFKARSSEHKYAKDLVSQISNLGRGEYLYPLKKHHTALDFCVGVAGYPEKHAEAPNLDADLMNLKGKVEAGADYIVTQMFFDNQKYYDFVKRCRKIGINVPIIPGLKPLSVLNHLTLIPKIFNIDLPVELANELMKCKDNASAKQVGTEWAIHQAKDLVANKVPSLHLYTYGLADNTKEILKAVF